MCAVIGVVLKQPTAENYDLIRRIFQESRIRGMHATGISWVKNNTVHTIKEPVDALTFVDKHFNSFDQYINEDGNLYMVGHCRYSTSDLDYNQPISSDKISIVHNGVVSQELPENWESIYGFTCETKNDTELLLKTVEENKEPLQIWYDASMSVCQLHSDKTFKYYRNGKRPLCSHKMDNGIIVASTKNIFFRAGVEKTIDSVMNIVYNVFNNDQIEQRVETNNEDLQYAL